MKLSTVKAANENWFNRGNKQFFGDLDYRVLHGADKKPYLVRSTTMWSDMFGGPKRVCWRVNPLSETGKILHLVETIFQSLDEVKEWLRGEEQ